MSGSNVTHRLETCWKHLLLLDTFQENLIRHWLETPLLQLVTGGYYPTSDIATAAITLHCKKQYSMHYFVTLFKYIEQALFIYIEQPLSEINGHLMSYKLCLFYGRFG